MSQHPAVPNTTPGQEAFPSVEEAWFWTIGAMRARHEGARGHGAIVARPCEPDDILRCLDRLYRNRRIDLSHARVLRIWGERRSAPEHRRAGCQDMQLWREAMDRLGPILRQKGIVAQAVVG
jgi:hypothetical protein